MMYVRKPYIKDMRHQADYALDAPDTMPAGGCYQTYVTSEEMDEGEPSITYIAVQFEVRREGDEQ